MLEGSGERSHYSKHDVYADKHTALSFNLGYTFNYKNITIEPLAGCLWGTRKWSAVNGYLQYPEKDTDAWNESLPKGELSGVGIIYEQQTWILLAGFAVNYAINDIFSVSASAALYPYIWTEALDSHIIRARQFYDAMSGAFSGFCVEAGVRYAVNGIRAGARVTASVMYEKERMLRGETSSGVIGAGGRDFTPSLGYGAGTGGARWLVKAVLSLPLGRVEKNGS